MLSHRLPRCLARASEQKNGLNWRRLYHVSKVTYHTFIQPDLPDIQFPAPCQTFPLTKDMWEKCPELSHYRRRVDRFFPMSAFIKLEYMGSQRFFPIVPSWPLFPDRPITQPRPARVSAFLRVIQIRWLPNFSQTVPRIFQDVLVCKLLGCNCYQRICCSMFSKLFPLRYARV